MDESELSTLAQEILEEAAEISGTATSGLMSLLVKALKTFRSALKKKN